MAMMEESHRKHDIIIFGATSFTGKWVIHEILRMLDKGEKFTWAIAGRSPKKMDDLLQEITNESGKDLSKIEKIQADVSDQSSLVEMAKLCQVCLNCVGPYQQWGEAVVKACAEQGTHHLDLSGEPLFLGQMEQKYKNVAETSGAFIIGACGFDSVPADLGATYLQQNFDGEVNSIEAVLELPSDGSPASAVHYGTYYSGVLNMYNMEKIRRLRRELYGTSSPPKPCHKLSRKTIRFMNEVDNYAVLLPFPDVDVLDRTQRHAFQEEHRKPVQTQVYAQMGFMKAVAFSGGLFFFSLITKCRCGVRLMEKHPKLFTFGMASHDGPSNEEMGKTKFTFTIVAKGWEDQKDKHEERPNKTKVLKVKGCNPAYGATVTIFLLSALTIIQERDKMPVKGGVYSPGIAFGKTSLVDRLNENGVTFTFQN